MSFDPSMPFEAVEDSAPRFDPSQPFEVVSDEPAYQRGQLPRVGAAISSKLPQEPEQAGMLYEAPARILKSAGTSLGDSVRGVARAADMVSTEQPNEAQFFAQKLAKTNTEAFPKGVDTNTSLLTLQDVPPPILDQWREEYRKQYGSVEDRLSRSTLANMGNEMRKQAQGITTDPTKDENFSTAVFEGIGSTVPVVMASAIPGVGLPLAATQYGLSQAEQGAQEASDMGGDEMQADVAFISNAGVGAFTEGLMSMGPRVWKMINQIRKAGVKPESFGKAVAAAVGEGALREGSQEGLEQFAQNLIASDVAGYEPDRPASQGVAKSAAVGATVGGLLGGGAAGTGKLMQKAEAPAQFDAKELERSMRGNQMRPSETEKQYLPEADLTKEPITLPPEQEAELLKQMGIAPKEEISTADSIKEMVATVERLLKENQVSELPIAPKAEPASPLPDAPQVAPTGNAVRPDMAPAGEVAPTPVPVAEKAVAVVAKPEVSPKTQKPEAPKPALRIKGSSEIITGPNRESHEALYGILEQQGRGTTDVDHGFILPSGKFTQSYVEIAKAMREAGEGVFASKPTPSAPTETGAAAPFQKDSRVRSDRYGAGRVIRQIGKRFQVQFDDGTKFAVSPGELKEAPALPQPEPTPVNEAVLTPEQQATFQRDLDEELGQSPTDMLTASEKRAIRGELEAEQPDQFEELLNRAIKATEHDPTKMMEGVTGAPVWITKAALNVTLKAIKAAYRGGKRLSEAIDSGIESLRSQNLKGFSEQEARDYLKNNVWENVEEGKIKVTNNRGPRDPSEPASEDVDKKVYTKGRMARTAANLMHGNALPKDFRDAREWGLNKQRYFEENLRLLVEDTRKALKTEFKKPEDQAAAEERLRQYWTGELEATEVGGPALQKAAATFRDGIDELTEVAVRNGLVPEEKKQLWLDNRGEWLRRTYLAFDPSADWNYDTLKRSKERGDAEVTRIWNGIENYLKAQNPTATPKDIEAAMRELIDRREAESALLGSTPPPGSGKRYAVDTGSLLRRKNLPIEVREWMGEIKDPFVRGLQSGKWMSQFITRNLVQRRFAKVGLKMGVLSEKPSGENFVELYPNQNRLVPKKDADGNPVKTPDGETVAEWRQSVDRRFEPLHGYFTSPEFKAALDEFNVTLSEMQQLADTAQVALKAYTGTVKASKWALVGMNPYSYMVNTIGGQILRLAAGGVNPVNYAKAFKAVLRGQNPIDVEATQSQLRDRAMYLLATKSGLIGKGIMQGDIQGSSDHRSNPEAWKQAKKAIVDITKDWRASGAWSRLRRSLVDIAMKPGNFGIKFMDDVFRVSAFLDELDTAQKAYPEQSHEKQVEWAAERASNTYQNYDKLPDAIRGASQLGMLNTFVSFKVEMFRNAFWILRYGYEGMKSDNPVLRRDGAKKLMAFSAMVTLPFVVSALSRLRFADDEKESFEDVNAKVAALQRSVVPPWDAGEELMIIGKDGNTWSYVPMGYVVPTYEVSRPIATLISAAKEEDGEAALKRIMQGFASDYIGPGTVAGPVGEAVFNKTLSGATVTQAEGMRGFKERAGHALSTLRPKIGDPVFEHYKATVGELGNYGRKYTTDEVMMKLAGLRVRTVDVEKQLPYKMREFSRRFSDAKSESTSTERKNPGQTEKIAEAKEYTAEKREQIKREYRQFKKDMVNTLGVSSGDFQRAQKDAGVSSELRAAANQ